MIFPLVLLLEYLEVNKDHVLRLFLWRFCVTNLKLFLVSFYRCLTFYYFSYVGHKIVRTHFAVRLCQKTISLNQKCVEPTDDLERIVEAADKLKVLIDGVLSYVEDVIMGKREPDNEIGRALLSMVHSVPKMSSEQFQNMFNTNVKVSISLTCVLCGSVKSGQT